MFWDWLAEDEDEGCVDEESWEGRDVDSCLRISVVVGFRLGGDGREGSCLRIGESTNPGHRAL